MNTTKAKHPDCYLPLRIIYLIVTAGVIVFIGSVALGYLKEAIMNEDMRQMESRR